MNVPVPDAIGSNIPAETPVPDQVPPLGENATSANEPVPWQTVVSFPALTSGIEITSIVLVSDFSQEFTP